MAPRPIAASQNGSGGSSPYGSGLAAIATSPAPYLRPMLARASRSNAAAHAICRGPPDPLGGSNMGLPIFADLSSRRVLPVLFFYFDEPVANADALVEDEAAPVPAALDRGNLLKIGEDAALEVNDILDALAPQEGRRFLAADAAGAEHGNALSREALGVGPPPVRKF